MDGHRVLGQLRDQHAEAACLQVRDACGRAVAVLLHVQPLFCALARPVGSRGLHSPRAALQHAACQEDFTVPVLRGIMLPVRAAGMLPRAAGMLPRIPSFSQDNQALRAEQSRVGQSDRTAKTLEVMFVGLMCTPCVYTVDRAKAHCCKSTRVINRGF